MFFGRRKKKSSEQMKYVYAVNKYSSNTFVSTTIYRQYV